MKTTAAVLAILALAACAGDISGPKQSPAQLSGSSLVNHHVLSESHSFTGVYGPYTIYLYYDGWSQVNETWLTPEQTGQFEMQS